MYFAVYLSFWFVFLVFMIVGLVRRCYRRSFSCLLMHSESWPGRIAQNKNGDKSFSGKALLPGYVVGGRFQQCDWQGYRGKWKERKSNRKNWSDRIGCRTAQEIVWPAPPIGHDWGEADGKHNSETKLALKPTYRDSTGNLCWTTLKFSTIDSTP